VIPGQADKEHERKPHRFVCVVAAMGQSGFHMVAEAPGSFLHANKIFYLGARFDLFLHNSYGVTAFIVTVLLTLLLALWIAMTLRHH